MRNLILLLVLLSGLVAGYFVGDYRGKAAREALEKAVAAGKEADSERLATIAKLNTDLVAIGKKYEQDLAQNQSVYNAKAAAWQNEKQGLDAKIKHQSAKVATMDARLAELAAKRDSTTATGDDKVKLQQEIDLLQKERDSLRQQNTSDMCLKVPLPRSVFDALNTSPTTGSK